MGIGAAGEKSAKKGEDEPNGGKDERRRKKAAPEPNGQGQQDKDKSAPQKGLVPASTPTGNITNILQEGRADVVNKAAADGKISKG